MKRGGGRGGKIDPPPHPEKTALKKPSLVRVKTKTFCVSPWYLISSRNVVSDLLFESMSERML